MTCSDDSDLADSLLSASILAALYCLRPPLRGGEWEAVNSGDDEPAVMLREWERGKRFSSSSNKPAVMWERKESLTAAVISQLLCEGRVRCEWRGVSEKMWVKMTVTDDDKIAVFKNINKDLHTYEYSSLSDVISGVFWSQNHASKSET